jgi:hypothetical protein
MTVNLLLLLFFQKSDEKKILPLDVEAFLYIIINMLVTVPRSLLQLVHIHRLVTQHLQRHMW